MFSIGCSVLLEGQHIGAFLTMNVASVGTSSLLHSIQQAVLHLACVNSRLLECVVVLKEYGYYDIK